MAGECRNSRDTTGVGMVHSAAPFILTARLGRIESCFHSRLAKEEGSVSEAGGARTAWRALEEQQ